MSTSKTIPRLEMLIGGLIIKLWKLRHPPGTSAALLRAQQRELARLIDDAGPRATERVQIRRLPGLEPSSTNYSLAMVADHLARVNRDIAATLQRLAANMRGDIEVVIANYKPDPFAEPGRAMADLEESILRLESALRDLDAIRKSTQTHAHPWFGDLPATTWACFPPFHQTLHLKQARLIIRGLAERTEQFAS